MQYEFRQEWLGDGRGRRADEGGADMLGSLPGPEEREGLYAGDSRAGMLAACAVDAAQGVTAPDMTRAAEAARILGLPEAACAATPERTRLDMAVSHLRRNPGLAQWAAQSPEKGAVARDNADWALRVREAFRIFGEGYEGKGVAGGIGGNMGKALANGVLDMAGSLWASLKAVPDFAAGPDNLISKFVDERLKENKAMRHDLGQARGAEKFFYDFLANGPQIAGQIGAALTVGPMAAAAFMGQQIFGGSYRELREKGVKPEHAIWSAGANAAAQSWLENLGLGKILNVFKSGGIMQALQRTAGAAATEGLTEAAQKAPEFLTHKLAESNLHGSEASERLDWFLGQITDRDNLWQATCEAIYEGAIGALWGGLGSGAGGMMNSAIAERNKKRAREGQAVETAALLARERGLAQNAISRKIFAESMREAVAAKSGAANARDRAATEQLIAASLPEHAATTWITPDDLDALLQEDTQGTLALLGIDMETAAQALETGAPLPVNTAHVLAQLDETDLRLPENSDNNVSHETGGDVFRETFGDVSRETGSESGGDVSHETDNVVSRETSGDVSRETGVESVGVVSHETNNVVSRETSGDVSHETGSETSGDVSHETDNLVSRETFGDVSHETGVESGGVVSHETNNVVSRETSGDVSHETGAESGGDVSRETDNVVSHETSSDVSRESGGVVSRETGSESGGVVSHETDNVVSRETFGDVSRYAGAEVGIGVDSGVGVEAGAGLTEVFEGAGFGEGKLSSESFPSPQTGDDGDGRGDYGRGGGGRSVMRSLAGRVADALRMSPEGLSGYEARRWDPEARLRRMGRLLNQDDDLEDLSSGEEDLSSGEEALSSGELDAELVREERRRRNIRGEVRKRITRLRREMVAAGLTEHEADANAFHLEAHALAWNATYGADPAALLDRIRIESAGERDLGDVAEARDGGGRPRGQAIISGARAIIRLFPNRNLSTVLHESAHVYIDDLIGMAADNGSTALANLERRVQETLMKEPEGTAEILANEIRRALAVPGGETRSALNACLMRFRDMSRRGRAAAREEAGRKVAEDQVMSRAMRVESLLGEARAAERCARLTREAIRHLGALERARADVRILAGHAGLSGAETELILAKGAGAALREKEGPDSDPYVRLQEAAARGFEQYVMEGRAPSRGLRPFFAVMSQWLGRIYAAARHILGRQINDEVRGVFDRLLASEAEMRQLSRFASIAARERAFMEMAGLSPGEMDNLEAKLQASLQSENLDGEKGRREFMRSRINSSLKILKEQDFWKVAENAHISLEDAREILGAERAEALARARPGLISVRGRPAGEVCLDSGAWPDASAMLGELYSRLVEKGESMREIARARALEDWEARERKRGEQEDARSQAAYGDYLEALDAATLRLLGEKRFGKDRQKIEALMESWRTPRVYLEDQAANLLNDMPMESVMPGRFHAKLDRALRQRLEAMRKGDVAGAFSAVQEARLANEMIRQANALRQEAEKIRNLAAKTSASRPGTFPDTQTEALRWLLRGFGFGEMRGSLNLEVHSYGLSELVRQCDPESMEQGGDIVRPTFPDWLLQLRHPASGLRPEGGHIPFNHLNISQMRQFENLLKYLRHTGYNQNRANAQAEAAAIDKLAREAASRMDKLPEEKRAPEGSLRRKLQNGLASIYASVDSLRWQFKKADGLSSLPGRQGESGPMERLFEQVLAAERRVKGRQDRICRDMAPHVAHLAKFARSLEKQYGKNLNIVCPDGSGLTLPESIARAYGRSNWTSDMVIALALNCGNKSNMERIASGYPDLSHAQLAAILGSDLADAISGRPAGELPRTRGLLKAEDWLAIQGIWDALSTQWIDTQKAHEKMFGFSPEGIPPRSFLVRDDQGVSHLISGGYYPVRYDPEISDRAGQWSEKEDILARNDSLFMAPSAKRGHTLARTQGAPRLPLLLNTSIIMQHVSDATRFIELGWLTRHLDRVTRNDTFRQAYERAFGKTDYNAIRPNLRGLVREERPGTETMTIFANKIRKYLVPWGLAWNFKVAALQITAIFPGMGDVGAKEVCRALNHLALHGPSTRRRILEVSPYMLSRLQNIDQDLSRAVNSLGPNRPKTINMAGREISWEDVVNAGMTPLVMVDSAATCAIWLAAYNKRLTELRQNPQLSKRLAEVSRETPGTPAPPPKRPAKPEQEDSITWDTPASPGTSQILDGLNANTQVSRETNPPQAPYGTFQVDDAFHMEACQYADSMVKQGNPDYDPSSRSGFLRSQGVHRLFNQFSSAVTLFAARHRYMYSALKKGQASHADIARFELYDTILPAISMFLLLSLVRGAWGGDPKDDKELAKTALTSFMDFASMRLPLFGSALTESLSSVSGLAEGGNRKGDVRTAIDAPFQIYGTLADQTGKTLHGKGGEKLGWALADLVSFLLRVPVSKVAKRAQKGAEQWQQGHGTPLSMLSPR